MHALFLLLSVLAEPPGVEVRTLDDQVIRGALLDVHSKGVQLQTDRGEMTVASGDVMTVRMHPGPEKLDTKAAVWIRLVDGSQMVALSYTASERTASITLTGGDSIEVPTRDIETVRFQSPSDATAASWQSIVEAAAAADRMVIRRKDDSIQPVEGIVRNVSAERIEFQIDGETVPVSRAKVDGVIYYHAAGRKLPRPLCFVEDVTGQRLAAVGATLAGDHLQLQTVCGLKLRRPLRVLSRLDFSAGKVQFLSDLKHELVRYTPYVGPATQAQIRRRRPRNDCSLDGRTLELRFPEKDDAAEPLAYAKGVSLHSRTLLVYRLPGRYRRFRAVAGIDPAMAGRGHVRLVVAGDDKELRSTVLAGSKDPVTIDVDITGVTRLKILVDFGENRDDADRVHLCDARVIQ